MSTLAGAFDETILNDIRVKADEIGLNDRIMQQLIPQFEVLKAIQAVQTANLTPLFRSRPNGDGGSKKLGVEIWWDNYCAQAVAETFDCSITCDKASTNAQTYDITKEYYIDGCFSQVDYIDNDSVMMDAIGKFFISADAKLIEALAAYAVAVINTNKGTNALTTGKGVVSGTDTYIIPGYWNSTLLAYLYRVAVINKFTNPVLLSGSNLMEDWYIANANMDNEGKKDQKNLFNIMRSYFDPFNVDSVNTPDLYSYLLSTGSMAMANITVYPDSVTQWGSDKVYTMASKFLPGIKYDVMYKAECDSGALYKHSFKVMLRADIFVNPSGCDQTNTGILSFICGSDS